MNQIEKLLTDIPFDSSKLILTNYFSLQQHQDLSVILELYKEGIKIKNKNNTEKWLFFDFEIKFTLLRSKKETPDQQHLTNPYGLKFERSTNYQELIVYSSQIPMLLQWRDELSKLINQRGFHDLYKPFRKIGKGNSATVYLAQRNQDKKKVAIKAFAKQSMSSQTKGKESLINEIKIMRYFNHNSLMKLHEVFETDNSFYLVIEHLEGGQLFEKLNSRRFNLKQIQQILRTLSEGLVEMHKNRIIHRDLKPENLIFRHQNDYKSIVIADYGLATKEDQQEYIFIRCGTPGYVAPQIITFKGKTGQSTISDIFSLGIIAHILSTGRSPFSGKQYQAVLNQNKQANFNFDLQIYKHVDPIMLDLIKQMMKVNPQQRIKTQQLLNHQFFQIDRSEQIIANQQFTTDLPHEKNNKKGIQKILDSNGSFIVPRPQILNGNQQQYVSMNNVGSSSSVSCSPQSIKISSFVAVKRQRQPTSPFDTQFKVGHRKAIGRNRAPQLMQSKQDKKQTEQDKKQTKQDIKCKQKSEQQIVQQGKI